MPLGTFKNQHLKWCFWYFLPAAYRVQVGKNFSRAGRIPPVSHEIPSYTKHSHLEIYQQTERTLEMFDLPSVPQLAELL